MTIPFLIFSTFDSNKMNKKRQTKVLLLADSYRATVLESAKRALGGFATSAKSKIRTKYKNDIQNHLLVKRLCSRSERGSEMPNLFRELGFKGFKRERNYGLAERGSGSVKVNI